MGEHCDGKAKGLQRTMYLGVDFFSQLMLINIFFIKVAAFKYHF